MRRNNFSSLHSFGNLMQIQAERNTFTIILIAHLVCLCGAFNRKAYLVALCKLNLLLLLILLNYQDKEATSEEKPKRCRIINSEV